MIDLRRLKMRGAKEFQYAKLVVSLLETLL
jgi:hypothetical protein